MRMMMTTIRYMYILRLALIACWGSYLQLSFFCEETVAEM